MSSRKIKSSGAQFILRAAASSNLLLHILRGAQRGIAVHESDAAGVGANVDGSKVGVRRDHSDPRDRTTQSLSGDLRDHGVRALADVGRAGVDDHAAVAIDLDVDGGVRHVGANDRVGRAAHVVTARHAQAAALGQLTLALFPAGALDHFLDALGQAVALHAQAVHRDAGRLEQIVLANLGGIHADLGGQFVELRFEGKADVDRAVAAHGAADRLVGQHAIAVVLNVGNVVERAQQRAGVKNGDDAVGAVGAAILDDAGFDGGDAAVVLDSGLQIDDGARDVRDAPRRLLRGCR